MPRGWTLTRREQDAFENYAQTAHFGPAESLQFFSGSGESAVQQQGDAPAMYPFVGDSSLMGAAMWGKKEEGNIQ
jgi:hypothetical protein